MNAVIELNGRLVNLSPATPCAGIVRLSGAAPDPELPLDRQALLVEMHADQVLAGYQAYFFRGDYRGEFPPNSFRLPKSLYHLSPGDVVRFEPTHGRLRVLYRVNSPSNSFLLTERCDNYCIMCSQPPKDRNDDWLVDELLETIPLLPKMTRSAGLTGGEPALLGHRFLEVLESFAKHLPTTHLHVLSNGRAFRDIEFARAVSAVHHPALMFGIPLYSALSNDHDFVVQARGAYDDTVRGILNLKRHGVPVELRFVIHEQTIDGLAEFAAFVARNLVFVDHVALMGLELMGFARTNLEAIWIDPIDYTSILSQAVTILERSGVPVSIYNHQLCTLPSNLWPFARPSISDWKNEYAPECDACSQKGACGGFFVSSNLRRSRGIRPISEMKL